MIHNTPLGDGEKQKGAILKSLKTIIPVITAVGIASPALAQFNYTGQDRGVNVYAAANSEGVADSRFATNFLPFHDGGSVSDGNGEAPPFNYASATAYQDSTLSANSFSYYGNVVTTAQENGYGYAQSFFSVTFNVSSPTGFTLNGGSYLEGGPQQLSQIARMGRNLSGVSFVGGEFDSFWFIGEEISLTGLLVPNVDYSLTFDFTTETSSLALTAPLGSITPNVPVFSQSSSGESGITFSATTAVPESGTVMAGAMLAGLALWQWRRRRA